MNSEISAQDETIINEILDKGINQIRLNRTYETNKSNNTSNKTYEYNGHRNEHSPYRRDYNNVKRVNNIPIEENKKEKGKYLSKVYNTITSGELYSFKNDLKSLQDNIDRIEHKLFNSNTNASKIISPLNTSGHNEIIDYTKSILGKSNHTSHTNHTNHSGQTNHHNNPPAKEIQKENPRTRTLPHTDKGTPYNRDYESSLQSQLKDQENLVNMLRSELQEVQKSKEDLSYAYFALKEENSCLIKELNQHEVAFKETGELRENFLRLRQDYDQLVKDYQISKDIRHEQNKIIKSLHNEIDYLRRNFDVKVSKISKEKQKQRPTSADKEVVNDEKLTKKTKKKKKLISKSKEKPKKVSPLNKKPTVNFNLKKISSK